MARERRSGEGRSGTGDILRLRPGSAGYPSSFLALQRRPDPLYVRGAVELLGPAVRRVAIVGTRQSTNYGDRTARRLASTLARAGVVVVSGLARGIDAAAHEGTLDAGGHTIAVLGTGVDVPYPTGHARLMDDVVRTGAVVSAYEPGLKGAPWQFVERNALIAALAELVVVVEAGGDSGALQTLDWATKMGKKTGVVPGPIDSPMSIGCNRLLASGCVAITHPDDLLTALSMGRAGENQPSGLDPIELAIWQLLAKGVQDPDRIASDVGVPVRRVLEGLGRLELMGILP